LEDELREVLNEMKDTTNRGFARLEGKVEGLSSGLQAHMLESATRHVEVSSTSKAAHRRMDEHLDDHKTGSGRRWELIVALAIAALSGVGTLIMALVQLYAKKGP